VLVVGARVSTRRQVVQAVDVLEEAGSDVVGTVLNGALGSPSHGYVVAARPERPGSDVANDDRQIGHGPVQLPTDAKVESETEPRAHRENPITERHDTGDVVSDPLLPPTRQSTGWNAAPPGGGAAEDGVHASRERDENMPPEHPSDPGSGWSA